MGYMLILFAPTHLLGLLFSIGLVHWLRNRGVFLAAVAGALYAVLFVAYMEHS
jgi:hypothetical protein